MQHMVCLRRDRFHLSPCIYIKPIRVPARIGHLEGVFNVTCIGNVKGTVSQDGSSYTTPSGIWKCRDEYYEVNYPVST